MSIVFETPSGYGKSTVIQMFFPIQNAGLEPYVYRSDKFTPKAFVSHAANQTEGQLRKGDLLPKLSNRVLLTKELAPIFRGREEELKENFSILIAVLDGKGFTSDSGAKGKRGYEHDIVFNWLGATTPIPRETHKLMAQLGTRLLFFEVPAIVPTEDELLAYAERDDASQSETECQQAANDFLVEFFQQHPVSSVPPESIPIPQKVTRQLVRLALLTAKGRAEIAYEKEGSQWKPIRAKTPEGPYKIVGYFKELVRSHASIHERTEVTDADLELIEWIAISSLPGHLQPVVRELQRTETVTSPQCQKLCGVSRPTARRYLEELHLLGIVALKPGSRETNEPDTASLAEDFKWLGPNSEQQPQSALTPYRDAPKQNLETQVGGGV